MSLYFWIGFNVLIALLLTLDLGLFIKKKGRFLSQACLGPHGFLGGPCTYI